MADKPDDSCPEHISPERLRFALDHSSDAIYWIRPDGSFAYVNESAGRMLGYTREQLLARTIEHIDPAHYERWASQWNRIQRRGSETFRTEHTRCDGSKIPMEITSTFVRQGGEELLLAIARDISRRVRAERELQEQVDLMQALLNTIPSPIFYKDRNLRYVGCNRAFEELLDMPQEQIVGKTVYDIAGESVAKTYDEHDQELIKRGGNQTYESHVKAPDANLWDVLFNKAAFRDIHGQVAGLVGVITDITELKQTQRALEESQCNLQNLMMQLEEMIFILDRDGEVLQANPACWTRLEVTREEIVGRSIQDLLNAEFPRKIEQLRMKLVDGEPFGGILTFQPVGKPPRRLRCRLTPGRWSNQDVGLLLCLPPEELSVPPDREKSARNMPLHSPDFLQTVLSDLNAVMISILGNVELARVENVKPLNEETYFENIERATALMCDMVRNLRNLIVRDTPAQAPVQLSEILEELRRFLQRILPTRIHLQIECDTPLPACQVDPNRLRHILLHLLRHTIRRMDGRGGGVMLQAHRRNLTRDELAPCLSGQNLPAGEYLCLDITNTPPQTESPLLETAFDPFDLTETPSERPHRDQSDLRRLADALASLGGAMQIRTTSGDRTSLRLLLTPAVQPVPRGSAHHACPRCFTPATILLVDDQEPVRKVTERMLQRCGLEALSASDGPEALELFRANPQACDLVMLDLGLPGLPGAEVYDQIKAVRPDLPVVICTGLSEADAQTRLEGVTPDAILRKPFQIQQLEETLAPLLPVQAHPSG